MFNMAKMDSPKILLKWIGPKITTDGPVVKANYYKSLFFGDISFSIGEHVLIMQARDKRENESGCDVAKILYLYESTDKFIRDKFRAIVQWYSRPQAVPSNLHTENIVMDFEKEVVQDFRPFDKDVCIETFFLKCDVIFGDVENCASEILQVSKNHEKISYACRYSIMKKKNKAKYSLVPVLDMNEETLETGTPRSCRSRNKPGLYCELDQKRKYTPRRIGKPSILQEGELPRTPRSGKKSTLQTKSAETPQNADENNENSTQEWSIKKKTKSKSSKCIRDITNSIEEQECEMSPEIPIVSPIKLVNVAKFMKDRVRRGILNTADINACLDSDDEIVDVSSINRNNPESSKKIGVRRNLNDSLTAETNDEMDIDYDSKPKLKYSVILDEKKPIKIKLRISDEKTNKRSKSTPSCKTLTSEEHDMNCIIKSPLIRLQKLNLNDSPKRSTEMTDSSPTPTRSSRIRTANSRYSEDYVLPNISPKKQIDTPTTRAVRSLRSLSISNYETPRKRQVLSNMEEQIMVTPVKDRRVEELQETPKRRRAAELKTPESTPGLRMKQFKAGMVTPTMQTRDSRSTPSSGLNLARERLHVSAVPKSLPCRESEFNDIFTFLHGKISDGSGGCMYISGVPGTGKTATVSEVIKCLQKLMNEKQLPKFEFIEVNGMRLTEPRQAYVHIYRQIEGKTVSWEQALSALDKKFTTSKKKTPTVLLVDELDVLCTRRQDVVYTILDWPSKANAGLVVVTIANTMDLPERLLRAKVTSRLGLTRRTFAPYTHKQLMDIVMSRLSGTDSFNSDAVQLVARKVAAVSGDARRALDICRRATEIAEYSEAISKNTPGRKKKSAAALVSMAHVNKALSEMISSAKVTAIQSCSALEKMLMQAVAAEVARTGVEETTFGSVFPHVLSLCALEGLQAPPTSAGLAICSRLGSRRLLITESARSDLDMKVLLNVGSDDLHYALQQI